MSGVKNNTKKENNRTNNKEKGPAINHKTLWILWAFCLIFSFATISLAPFNNLIWVPWLWLIVLVIKNEE
jgi:hypothetical protein